MMFSYITFPRQIRNTAGLEIWGTIINGFSIPLKEEHKVFLTRVLIHLHRPKGMQKEVLLIGELEELVEIMEPEEHRILALPLCTQITKCLNSWNSQVAERALYVWNNEQFVKMASQDIEVVFPIVVEGMEKNLKWHWSGSVRQLTENVKEMLEEMEPSLYSRCLSQLDLHNSATNQEEMRRKQRWESIEIAAERNQCIQDSRRLSVTN
ncbi:Serine/threonine protein phosphatase 2A 57 kDa regulatory subunit B' epsilon [Abeliophyllum distichum]|uniref:Serine/threonine protein phosphatase 2A 57 kDa regulatory subunit B' epsilon n=1 Tax=Abeliophyllum distichum TaxID=126358 RepID=A0ABD1PA25_9LAMI